MTKCADFKALSVEIVVKIRTVDGYNYRPYWFCRRLCLMKSSVRCGTWTVIYPLSMVGANPHLKIKREL